jgi:hypothetical protein
MPSRSRGISPTKGPRTSSSATVYGIRVGPFVVSQSLSQVMRSSLPVAARLASAGRPRLPFLQVHWFSRHDTWRNIKSVEEHFCLEGRCCSNAPRGRSQGRRQRLRWRASGVNGPSTSATANERATIPRTRSVLLLLTTSPPLRYLAIANGLTRCPMARHWQTGDDHLFAVPHHASDRCTPRLRQFKRGREPPACGTSNVLTTFRVVASPCGLWD